MSNQVCNFRKGSVGLEGFRVLGLRVVGFRVLGLRVLGLSPGHPNGFCFMQCKLASLFGYPRSATQQASLRLGDSVSLHQNMGV